MLSRKRPSLDLFTKAKAHATSNCLERNDDREEDRDCASCRAFRQLPEPRNQLRNTQVAARPDATKL